LRKTHDVKFYAFKRQYPTWLFPGKTDKDISRITITEDETENILDSLNPLTWWKVFRKVSKHNPDLLIFPWWVSFWAPQFWTISVLVKIFTNTKILFICHNVVAHESDALDKICTRSVLKRGDFFIVHSKEDFQNLKRMLPSAIVKTSFHPTYEIFNFKSVDKEEARKKLKLEGKILLFFGFIRPYKGLNYLINAMSLILRELDVTLLVVGEFWKGKENYLRQIEDLQLIDKVKIIDEYVPNEEVGVYFSSADLVVLPYISATQSGIAQIAFGFNKPVVTTNVGGISEAVENNKTGFIVNAGDSRALADAIISFYEDSKEGEFKKNIIKGKDKFSWDRMVEVIESFGAE